MEKAKFTVNEIIRATHPSYVQKTNLVQDLFTISTDSRNISEQDIFLALKGENFDGHEFVDNAIKQGIKIFIVNEDKINDFKDKQVFFIFVKNTLEAYLDIASFHRKKQNAKIVAVTGSSGKTTTKEMIYSVLSSKYKTTKSIKNHNNEIGMANTLLSIDNSCKYCVTEFGMRGLGEIELLTKTAIPDIGVITNVGPAHIGRLGSLGNIAKAKCELANNMKDNSILFIHDEELIKNNIKNFSNVITYSIDEIKIVYQDKEKSKFIYDDFEYTINETAEFNILNALVAIKIGLNEGVEPELIKQGLLNYKNVELRGEISKLSNGATIITDCYNANPDSVVSSIKSVVKTYSDKKIIVVFGDMLELGDYEEFYHKKIGQLIDELNVNYFVCCGKLGKIAYDEVSKVEKKYFLNQDEIPDFLFSLIDKDSLVLLKASRGMKFEMIQKRLIEK